MVCPPDVQEDTCNRHLCPIDCVYGRWDTVTPATCSVTCGPGTKVHRRKVLSKAAHGGKTCEEKFGAPTKTVECNNGVCSRSCVMNPWQGWSKCSKKCDDGQGGGKRHPIGNDRKECPVRSEEEDCNTHRCPINCVPEGWRDWTKCSSDCDASNGGRGGAVGGGFQERRRGIVQKAEYGGKECAGPTKLWEEKRCNKGGKLSKTCGNPDGCLCPIDCAWAKEWSDNSKCLRDNKEVTCGGGTLHQVKKIVRRPFGRSGIPCPSSTSTGRLISCATNPCPVDCVVGEWDHPNWATAPCLNQQGAEVKCGGGRKTRTRTLTEAEHGGKQCHLVTSGGEQQSKSCNDTPCPIDCEGSTWGENQDQADAKGWLPCSASCRRDATNGQSMGPSPTQKRMRFVTKWGNQWGKACGAGRQTRTRVQAQDERHGGRSCNDVYGQGWAKEVRDCDEGSCPVNCDVGCDPAKGSCPDGNGTGKWHGWSTCKNDSGSVVTCGGGRKTRTRDILSAGHTGVCARTEQVVPCAAKKCPIQCQLANWKDWNAAKGSNVRRVRKILTHPKWGGQPCAKLCAKDARTETCVCSGDTCSETTGWQMVPQYSTACAGILGLRQTGQWSKCDKNCKSGHQYRYVVKAMCSKTSVMKVHFKFRQGRFCNTRDTCVDELTGDTLPEFVSPKPRIPALSRKSVFNDYTGPDTAPSMRPYTKPNTGAVKDGNGNAVSQLPGSIMLDEELSWKTLSQAEVVTHGLEPGHWQIQV